MAKTYNPISNQIDAFRRLQDEKASASIYMNPNQQMVDPSNRVNLPGQFKIDDFEGKVADIDPLAYGLEGLQDERAGNQSSADKWANASGKMLLTAATTFLDSTVGTVVGAANTIKEGKFSGFYDNFFSNWMADLQENGEEILPNYYTRAEQERPWYENLTTANFWADKVLKNFGFMIGTVASSMLAGGAIRSVGQAKNLMQNISKGLVGKQLKSGRVLKETDDLLDMYKRGILTADDLTSEIIKDGKSLATLDFVSQAGASIIGSTGEARIEAIQSIREYAKKRKLENPNISEEALQKELTAVGNSVFSTNLAILSLGNAAQWGKSFGGGYSTQKNLFNKIGKGELGNITSGLPTTKVGKIGLGTVRAGKAIAKGPMWEGWEEQLQKVATESASEFYNAKEDPNAILNTFGYIDAFTDKLGEQFDSIDNWEEFFIGMISSGFGVPTIQNKKPALVGGVVNEFNEYYSKDKQNEAFIKAGNESVQNISALSNAAFRNTKWENGKEVALENDDQFTWENNENAQITNDIITALELGRYNEYVEKLAAQKKVTPEEVRKQYTQEDGTSLLENWSDEDITKSINKKIDKALDVAKYANDQRKYIEAKFKGAPPEVINEMIFIGARAKNLDERSNTISDELSSKGFTDGRSLQELERRKAQLEGTENYLSTFKGKLLNAKNQLSKLKNKDLKKNIQKVLTKLENDKLNEGINLEENINSINEILDELNEELAEIDQSPYYDRNFEKNLNKKYSQLSQQIVNLTNKKNKIESEINTLEDSIEKSEKQKVLNKMNEVHTMLLDYSERVENAQERLNELNASEAEFRAKVKETIPEYGEFTYGEFLQEVKDIIKREEQFAKDAENLYKYRPHLKEDTKALLKDLGKIEKERLNYLKKIANAYSVNGNKSLVESIEKAKKDKIEKQNRINFNNKYIDEVIVYDKDEEKEYKVKDYEGQKYLYGRDKNGEFNIKIRKFNYQEGVNDRYEVKATEDVVRPKVVSATKTTTTKAPTTPMEILYTNKNETIKEEYSDTYDPKPKVSPIEVQNKTTGHIGVVDDSDKGTILLFNNEDSQAVIDFQVFLDKNAVNDGKGNANFKGKPTSGAVLFGDKWAAQKDRLKKLGYINPDEHVYVVIVDNEGNPIIQNGRQVFTTLSTKSAFTPMYDSNGLPMKIDNLTPEDLKDPNTLILTKDKDGYFTSTRHNQEHPKNKVSIKEEYGGVFTDEVEVIKAKFYTNKPSEIYDYQKAEKNHIELLESLNKEPRLVEFSHKTMGVQVEEAEDYDIKTYITDNDLKEEDVDIEVSTGEGKITIGGKDYSVRKGFTYLIDRKNGRLIRVKPRMLNSEEKLVIKELLSAYCKQASIKNNKVDTSGANEITTKKGKTFKINESLNTLMGFSLSTNNASKDINDTIVSINTALRSLKSRIEDESNPKVRESLMKSFNKGIQSLTKIHRGLSKNKRSVYFQSANYDQLIIPGGYIVVGFKDNKPNSLPLFKIDENNQVLNEINPDVLVAIDELLQDKYFNIKARTLEKRGGIELPTEVIDGVVTKSISNTDKNGYKKMLLNDGILSTRAVSTTNKVKGKYKENIPNYKGELPTAVNRYLVLKPYQEEVAKMPDKKEAPPSNTKESFFGKAGEPKENNVLESDTFTETTTPKDNDSKNNFFGVAEQSAPKPTNIGEKRPMEGNKAEEPTKVEPKRVIDDNYLNIKPKEEIDNTISEEEIFSYFKKPEELFDKYSEYITENYGSKEDFLEDFNEGLQEDQAALYSLVETILKQC